MPRYPVFLDLVGRLAVVVGGGAAAERRARLLVRHGADVAVVAPDPTPELRRMQAEGELTLEDRDYVRGDLQGASLVVCVGTSDEVAKAVHEEAEAEGALVNVVGSSELGNFVVPSVVRRGPLQIAVSTGGLAPEVAKRIRRRLRDEFGDGWGEYVRLYARVRELAAERIDDDERRAAILERLADSDLLDRVLAGDAPTAEAAFAEAVTSYAVDETGETE